MEPKTGSVQQGKMRLVKEGWWNGQGQLCRGLSATQGLQTLGNNGEKQRNFLNQGVLRCFKKLL
jgi:hypothetical protein